MTAVVLFEATKGISINKQSECVGLPKDIFNVSITDGHENASNESLLWNLNHEKVLKLMPVIVYVAACVTLGIVGNSVVCYVYSFRLRRSTSRFFIIFLAALDLITCVVGACSELIDLAQPYVFTATWSCKILRFGLSFTIIAGSFILICVAFERYYKVCKPLKIFPVRKVKILCSVVAVVSVILALPAFWIFGRKTVIIEHYDLRGTECSLADEVQGTPLPTVYYGILFTLYLPVLASLFWLYIRIGFEIWKRKRLTIGDMLPGFIKEIKGGKSTALEETSINSCQDDNDLTDNQIDEYCVNRAISEDSCLKVEEESQNTSNANAKVVLEGKLQPKLKRQKSYVGRMSIRTLRTTCIFCVVSSSFVISFLPYLIVNLLKFTRVVYHEFHSISEEVNYNFCVRSYFISIFINPIIYSVLNINFRRECKKLLKIFFEKLKSCCFCRNE